MMFYMRVDGLVRLSKGGPLVHTNFHGISGGQLVYKHLAYHQLDH